MKIRAPRTLALLCLGLAGCSDSATSVVCPGQAAPALLVRVVDATTRESVAAEARGGWSTGAVSDSMRHVVDPNGESVLAVFGPPGTYQLHVQRPGYPEWVRSGVDVRGGACSGGRSPAGEGGSNAPTDPNTIVPTVTAVIGS